MSEGRPVVGLGGQSGDVGVGDVAGQNLTKISGADPDKIVGMLGAVLQYQWDDDQRRELRQIEADRERDRSELRWEMIRQSIEVIRQRLDHLDHAIADTHAEARRVRAAGMVIAAVLALLIVVTVILALDRYYLGGRLLLAVVGASGALSLYAATRSR